MKPAVNHTLLAFSLTIFILISAVFIWAYSRSTAVANNCTPQPSQPCLETAHDRSNLDLLFLPLIQNGLTEGGSTPEPTNTPESGTTLTPSATPTNTPTQTNTTTPTTPANTTTPTNTPTPTPTATRTATPTNTPSPTPTNTPTPSATPTNTPSPTPTQTSTATPTPTNTPTPDPAASCILYPIGIQSTARTLTDPNDAFVSDNDYPDAADFTYPYTPPSYSDFPEHTENLTFNDAEEGDLFYIQQGTGTGGFNWLVWNQYGAISSNNRLVDSLSYPGNSNDYGSTVSGTWPLELQDYYGSSNALVGYINTDDYTDTTLNIGDGVAVYAGATNSNNMHNILAEHIDLERVLPILLWSGSNGTGQYERLEIDRFVWVRLIGYRLPSGGDSWLLVEFVEMNDTCYLEP